MSYDLDLHSIPELDDVEAITVKDLYKVATRLMQDHHAEDLVIFDAGYNNISVNLERVD